MHESLLFYMRFIKAYMVSARGGFVLVSLKVVEEEGICSDQSYVSCQQLSENTFVVHQSLWTGGN